MMMMTTTERSDLVELIEARNLCCPEQVADAVLAVYDAQGWDAALAELERAAAADADAAQGLGVE